MGSWECAELVRFGQGIPFRAKILQRQWSNNGIDGSRGTHDPDEENLVCVTNTYVLNMFVKDFCQRDEEATSAYYKLVHSLYPCCQNQ